jgi:hypothetical protein
LSRLGAAGLYTDADPDIVYEFDELLDNGEYVAWYGQGSRLYKLEEQSRHNENFRVNTAAAFETKVKLPLSSNVYYKVSKAYRRSSCNYGCLSYHMLSR